MADGADIFKARIAATDDSSAVIAIIKEHLKTLGMEAKKVGHEVEHMHHPHVWDILKEHTEQAGEHFHELGEHVGELGEKITELVPAIGALGAAGSLVALLETTEKVAEAYGELVHQAQALGIGAQQLHEWNIVAKLTDTNADSMAHSMSRLNRTLAEAAAGKNKDAAGLFKHLHLNPKSFKDSADALPALASAFQHTTDATMRARMAQVLFGRAGMDMIPLLMKGAGGIKELQAEAHKLGFDFTGSGEALEAYNDSMKKIGIATDGFKDAIGAGIAPVLAPVIDDMTEWVVANRAWIATGITDEVKQVAEWIKAVPWHEVGEELRTWAHRTGEFVDAVGGAKTIVEVLAGAMLLKGVFFLGSETFQIVKFSAEIGKLAFKLGSELVGAWNRVGTAAETAAVEEKEAAAAAPGGAGGGLGPGIGAGKLAVKGVALAALTAGAIMDAQNGVQVSQDDIRDHPELAKSLTPAQQAKLPKHRGADQWAADTFGDTQPGHSFVGDALSSGWHRLFGGSSDPSAPPSGGPGGGITPPPAGSGSSGPPQKVEGEIKSTITITGAPPGTTVTATATGAAAQPKVDVGQAFHDIMP